jgi:3-oxoacyl-[acyl-carrier-protein] synthase II
METRTVAITGVGLISALGRGTAANWEAVAAGRSGVTLGGDPAHPAWVRWAGRVADASFPAGLDPKLMGQAKFLNRGAVLGLAAAWEAAQEAALPAALPARRRALYVATGDFTMADCAFLYPAVREASGGRFRELDAERLNRAAVDKVNPFFLLESITNNPFSFLSAALGCMGPGTSLSSQSPSGAHTVELGYRAVRTGRADAAVVVGCGAWVAPVPLLEMKELGLLSAGLTGAASFRPFDRRRDGFLAGDGGAALVLEPLEAARARGATVLGVVRGVGNAAGSSSRLVVHPEVALAAMREAMAEAAATPAELGFVCPHGSGTRKSDRSEGTALRELLDGAPVPVCALKPYTGHLGAASDVGEVVLGLSAAAHGVVPATLHFTATEPDHAGLALASTPQSCTTPLFLSVSYGLAGQVAAVVVEATPGR